MNTDTDMVEADQREQAQRAVTEQIKQQWKPDAVVSENNADGLASELSRLRIAHDQLAKDNENYKNEMIELKSIIGELKRNAEAIEAKRQHAPPDIEIPTNETQNAQAQYIGGDVTRLTDLVIKGNAELTANMSYVKEMTNANTFQIDKITKVVEKQAIPNGNEETANEIRNRVKFQNDVQEKHALMKRTTLNTAPPKFKFRLPHLDEYETFKNWKKALADWQAANPTAHEVYKIQECRDNFRNRKQTHPVAQLFWQRFEKVLEDFEKNPHWVPNLDLIVDKLNEDHYQMSDWEIKKREEHLWSKIEQIRFAEGTTKPEAFRYLVKYYERAVTAGVDLDLTDLASKVMKIKYLHAPGLMTKIHSQEFSIPAIETFLVQHEAVMKKLNKTRNITGLKPVSLDLSGKNRAECYLADECEDDQGDAYEYEYEDEYDEYGYEEGYDENEEEVNLTGKSKGRGKGSGKGKGRGKGKSKGKGKGKHKKKPLTEEEKEKIKNYECTKCLRKGNHPTEECWVKNLHLQCTKCKLKGHTAKTCDPKRRVNMVEESNNVNIFAVNQTYLSLPLKNEVFAGILDTGFTGEAVASQKWVENYQKYMKEKHGFKKFKYQEDLMSMAFQFGAMGSKSCVGVVTIPVYLDAIFVDVDVAMIDGELELLLGRRFLERFKITIDTSQNRYKTENGKWIQCLIKRQLLCLPLAPENMQPTQKSKSARRKIRFCEKKNNIFEANVCMSHGNFPSCNGNPTPIDFKFLLTKITETAGEILDAKIQDFLSLLRKGLTPHDEGKPGLLSSNLENPPKIEEVFVGGIEDESDGSSISIASTSEGTQTATIPVGVENDENANETPADDGDIANLDDIIDEILEQENTETLNKYFMENPEFSFHPDNFFNEKILEKRSKELPKATRFHGKNLEDKRILDALVSRIHHNTGSRKWPQLAKMLLNAKVPKKIFDAAKNHCKTCNKCRYTGPRPIARPSGFPIAADPWEVLQIDFFWEEGSEFLHICDTFSRVSYVARLKTATMKNKEIIAISQSEAIVELLYCQFFAHHGLPSMIFCDPDVRFDLSGLKELCRSCNITLEITAAKQHQAIGIVERHHQLLREFIRTLRKESDFQDCNIDVLCAIATMLHNAQISNVDGQTPAHRAYGRAPRIPMLTVECMNFADIENSVTQNNSTNGNFFDTCNKLQKCRKIWQEKDADARIIRAMTRANRVEASEQEFKIGQTVWFYHVSDKREGWNGPATVCGRTENKANIAFNGHEYTISPQFLKSAISVASKYGLVPTLQKLSPGGDLDFKEVPCSKDIKNFEKWKKKTKKKDVFFENTHFKRPDDGDDDDGDDAPWNIGRKRDVLDRFDNDDDAQSSTPGNVPGDVDDIFGSSIPSSTRANANARENENEENEQGRPVTRKITIEERIRQAQAPRNENASDNRMNVDDEEMRNDETREINEEQARQDEWNRKEREKRREEEIRRKQIKIEEDKRRKQEEEERKQQAENNERIRRNEEKEMRKAREKYIEEQRKTLERLNNAKRKQEEDEAKLYRNRSKHLRVERNGENEPSSSSRVRPEDDDSENAPPLTRFGYEIADEDLDASFEDFINSQNYAPEETGNEIIPQSEADERENSNTNNENTVAQNENHELEFDDDNEQEIVETENMNQNEPIENDEDEIDDSLEPIDYSAMHNVHFTNEDDMMDVDATGDPNEKRREIEICLTRIEKVTKMIEENDKELDRLMKICAANESRAENLLNIKNEDEMIPIRNAEVINHVEEHDDMEEILICTREIENQLYEMAEERRANEELEYVHGTHEINKNSWQYIQGKGWTDKEDILRLEQATGREIPEDFTWNSLGDGARARELDSYISYDAIERIQRHEIPKEAQILGARFVYTIKDDKVPEGEEPGPSHLDRFRRLDGRLCVQGYREELTEDVQSPTVQLESVRIIMAVSAVRNWEFGVIDVSRAYLQSANLERAVYVRPPRGAEKDKNIFWKAKKPLYGLSDSTKNWTKTVQAWIENIGGKKTLSDAGAYVFTEFGNEKFYRIQHDPERQKMEKLKREWKMPPDYDVDAEGGEVFGVITIHVDDILYVGSTVFCQWFEKSIFDKFKCKSPSRNDVKYLGMKIKKIRQKSKNKNLSFRIEINSDGYENSLKTIPISTARAREKHSTLTEEEEGQFRMLLGQMMWAARLSRGDIQADVAHIAQVYKNNRILDDNYDENEIIYAELEKDTPDEILEWEKPSHVPGKCSHMPGFDQMNNNFEVNKINVNKKKRPKNTGENFKTGMTVQNLIALNKSCRKMHSRQDASIIFTDFTDGRGIQDIGLLTYTDGALMNTVENRSQIGIVAMLASNSRPRTPVTNFNDFKAKNMDACETIPTVPIMWKSQKSPRVATSSHAAEIQGLFLGLDMSCVLRTFLAEVIYGNPLIAIQVDIRNDNLNVIRALHQLGNIGENKRLQTVIESMKELVDESAINSISYTPGSLNIADEMTKVTPANMIHLLCMRNELRIPTKEFISRKHMRTHNAKQWMLREEKFPEYRA